MTILLCPVTGVDTGGEAVELVELCGGRGLYGVLHSKSAKILVKESISASRLERLSSRVLPPGFPCCTLKAPSSRGGGGGKLPEPGGRTLGSSRGGGGGGRKSPSAPGCLYGLYLGFGATTGANFLGGCCVDTEMLGVPKEWVVSIRAGTWPRGSPVLLGGSQDG